MLLSNTEYLGVIAGTLERDVAPALQAAGAQSAAAMSIDGLRELIKREAVVPSLIQKWTPNGVELVDRLAVLVRGSDAADEALRARIAQVKAAPAGGAPTTASWSQLVAVLDEGAIRLVDLRDTANAANEDAVSDWLRNVAEWEVGYYTAFRDAEFSPQTYTALGGQALTAEKLAAHISARTGKAGLEVIDFRVNPGGFTNETFFFTLREPGAKDRRLVIRKNSANPYFAFWAHRAREEYQIVRKIFEAGLPVPEPLWLFTDAPDVDGDFYVMTHGRGRMVGTLAGASEPLSDTLLFSLANFLARLHAIPMSHFADYIAVGDTPVKIGDSASEAVKSNLDYVYRVWRAGTRLPSPAEAFTIDWLRRNVPPNPAQPSVVHTDCFVHNFLVENDEITTVVDWEATHFGDPAEDLAYIKDQVSLHMEWDRFMAHYTACGGPEINPASLDYFKTLLNFRNYFGTNIGVARIPKGFLEIRMLPLGSQFLTHFMEASLQGTKSTKS